MPKFEPSPTTPCMIPNTWGEPQNEIGGSPSHYSAAFSRTLLIVPKNGAWAPPTTALWIGQDVSFDEMMVPFSGRSKHTLKMKNKPISEGFKIWALCDHRYLWDFLFFFCI